eukprot:m.71498 g.71498  ORF g.71498 m.71498 type:complete len:112 (+) comp14218_c0_seq1:894-1229(+)
MVPYSGQGISLPAWVIRGSPRMPIPRTLESVSWHQLHKMVGLEFGQVNIWFTLDSSNTLNTLLLLQSLADADMYLLTQRVYHIEYDFHVRNWCSEHLALQYEQLLLNPWKP